MNKPTVSYSKRSHTQPLLPCPKSCQGQVPRQRTTHPPRAQSLKKPLQLPNPKLTQLTCTASHLFPPTTVISASTCLTMSDENIPQAHCNSCPAPLDLQGLRGTPQYRQEQAAGPGMR